MTRMCKFRICLSQQSPGQGANTPASHGSRTKDASLPLGRLCLPKAVESLLEVGRGTTEMAAFGPEAEHEFLTTIEATQNR